MGDDVPFLSQQSTHTLTQNGSQNLCESPPFINSQRSIIELQNHLQKEIKDKQELLDLLRTNNENLSDTVTQENFFLYNNFTERKHAINFIKKTYGSTIGLKDDTNASKGPRHINLRCRVNGCGFRICCKRSVSKNKINYFYFEASNSCLSHEIKDTFGVTIGICNGLPTPATTVSNCNIQIACLFTI